MLSTEDLSLRLSSAYLLVAVRNELPGDAVDQKSAGHRGIGPVGSLASFLTIGLLKYTPVLASRMIMAVLAVSSSRAARLVVFCRLDLSSTGTI